MDNRDLFRDASGSTPRSDDPTSSSWQSETSSLSAERSASSDWLAQDTETGSSAGTGGSAMAKAKDAASTVQDKAGAAADTAKEKASAVADQATTKVDAGMDKAAGGLESVAQTIRDKGQSVGGDGSGVQTAVATTAEKLDTAAQYLREKDTEQLMTELEALVRRKPVESVLVAAGVGFLLSKALR